MAARLLFGLVFLSTLSGADFTGRWLLNANGFQGELNLWQTGNQVQGWIGFEAGIDQTVRGAVNGNEIRFSRSGLGLRAPQEYRGYIFAKGGQGIAGVFSHEGDWANGWSASRAGAPKAAPGAQPPAVQPGNIDPAGTWRNGDATWTFTRAADGRYHAQETGYGNSSGTAYFASGGVFRIDYVTRDGNIRGYYEMKFSPDGRTATGLFRELTGSQNSGSSNWTRTGGEAGNIDPAGTWRNGDATWTFTRAADGRYHAQETGYGNSSGTAYFTSGGVFRIDYVTRDGNIRGYYEMKFSADGRTASGLFRELTGSQNSGPSNWTRTR